MLQTRLSEECYVRMNVLLVGTSVTDVSYVICMMGLAIESMLNHLSAHSVVGTIKSS